MQQRFSTKSYFLSIIAFLLLGPVWTSAQQNKIDTLTLTINQADSIFLQKNLTLLANEYNVDLSKALVQQARVWDNPVLNTDQNIYDGKFFRHKTENGLQYGQVYIQVQQLIRTAGKIKKLTRLAEDNVLNAEAQFNEVMRNLKFLLTTNLNNLAQLQNVASIYQAELQSLETLVKGMDEMLKMGDISLKENTRIKALLFSIQNDYADNLRQQIDLQKEIGLLLQSGDTVWIVANVGQSLTIQQLNDLSLAGLQDSALLYRPDMALTKNISLFQQHNIAYQKALAKPDYSIGLEYDKLNSYVPNYYGLAVSVPLPLFNRNKGSIAAAEFAFKQNEVVVQQVQNQVAKEVSGAWQKLKITTALINNDNNLLRNSYDELMKNMISSYRERQVGLIEFIDFLATYKETRIKQWQLVTAQRNAAAELNHVINQNVIKL